MATEEKGREAKPDIKAQNQAQAERQPNQRRMRLVEEGVNTLYFSFFTVALGPDGVALNFGNQSLDGTSVRIQAKMVVSLKMAKRLNMALADLIRKYESQNGVIDISVGRAPLAMDKKGISDPAKK